MDPKTNLTIPSSITQAFLNYKDRPALGIVGQIPFTYGEIDQLIKALMAFLEQLGITQGDKVAILSGNMPNWGITYFATTFMGAIVVPLLPDFHPDEIEKALTHSEAKVLFVSDELLYKVEHIKIPSINSRVRINDFKYLDGNSNNPEFNKSIHTNASYPVNENDVASIIYTSGTTGQPKGVMLTHKNICSNALSSRIVQHVVETDRFLSLLPLSHTYENTLGFILPMICGASVSYLNKPPTPSVLSKALLDVKPTTVLSVPLIIEKLYYSRVVPTFNKNQTIKKLYSIPLIRKWLNRMAGRRLMKSFGGELHFFGIGGAKLNKTVEVFLREANFPYAIGYGLTETSPLLAGSNPSTSKLQSTGPAIKDVQLKIHDPNPVSGEGEIWAKGPNVMKGYYKDEQRTKEVMTKDGWFITGDLGVFDEDNNLYIKGRSKNIIIGANGENIYPEEIESIINDFPYVGESLVIQKKEKLVALVHFNLEELEEQYQHMKEELTRFVEKKTENLKKGLFEYINSKVNKFSQVHEIEHQKEPFIKTATKKIKRYLYK